MTDQPAPKSPAFHHITDLLTANLAFPSQTADQIALLLVEDEDALLAALGHDNCVPAQHCAERAEAERDRLREALNAIAEGRPHRNYDPGNRHTMEATHYGWLLAAKVAHAALDGEDTA